ncbi:MAG TPA: YwqG family protein [Ktedonobacterales bacterium]|nr:YwqG family protein [Ktedonobacterales bacterium]
MDTSAVVAALRANGLSAFTDVVDRLAQASLRLIATPTPDSAIPVSASRLGGLPDLPPEQSWPATRDGAPMSFVGQIRLQDAHALASGAALPAEGLLSFFYDASQRTYGADPNDRTGFRVLYFDTAAHAGLAHQAGWPAALPSAARFGACSVAFAPELTYAQDLQAEFPERPITPQDQERFEAALTRLAPAPSTAPRHRLLGHPDTIQDDMRQECQLAANGVADPSAEPQRVAAFMPGANQWRLLLQVDSDARVGMRWASAGMLYFWIREQDLASARFDNCWVVLQSD